MTDGWRNWLRALVAFAISFVLVGILEAVLLDDRMRITFTITAGQSNNQENIRVVVKTTNGDTERQLDGLQKINEISLLNPYEKVTICLPKEWNLENWNANQSTIPVPTERCWNKAGQNEYSEQGKNIKIILSRQITPDNPIPPDRPGAG